MIDRIRQFWWVGVLLVVLLAVAAGLWISPGAAALVVSGVLLLVVLAVGWTAVTSLLSADEDLSSAPLLREGAVATLKAEKASLLQVLRDLETERDLGKVSTEDFSSLEQHYRGRTINVMKKLDRDLAGAQAKAEALIRAALEKRTATKDDSVGTKTESTSGETAHPSEPKATRSCPACAGAIDLETVFCKTCGIRVTCEACAAELDPDSVFCKKCGKKVEKAHA